LSANNLEKVTGNIWECDLWNRWARMEAEDWVSFWWRRQAWDPRKWALSNFCQHGYETVRLCQRRQPLRNSDWLHNGEKIWSLPILSKRLSLKPLQKLQSTWNLSPGSPLYKYMAKTDEQSCWPQAGWNQLNTKCINSSSKLRAIIFFLPDQRYTCFRRTTAYYQDNHDVPAGCWPANYSPAVTLIGTSSNHGSGSLASLYSVGVQNWA